MRAASNTVEKAKSKGMFKYEKIKATVVNIWQEETSTQDRKE
jgi:hypothetical protein